MDCSPALGLADHFGLVVVASCLHLDYSNIRPKYYRVDNFKDIFEKVHISLVLEFLKEAGLYYKV